MTMTGRKLDMNSKNSAPVVVGIDGSEASVAALRYARNLARLLDRSVLAMSAWQLPAFYGGGPWAYEWDPADNATRVLDDAVIEVYGDANPGGLSKEVVEGNPAAVLIKQSKDAVMVVVGSRGHGGFTGLLLGSVSTAVAAHASSPVLVIH
jgi:nucleotide-binding universal stress UspA family protein